ncbi:MAG TPA: hypothetical protein PLZ22_02555 [Thermotogota bacterium]|nr:hypothetical protein [Thermotogota bacterium]
MEAYFTLFHFESILKTGSPDTRDTESRKVKGDFALKATAYNLLNTFR